MKSQDLHRHIAQSLTSTYDHGEARALTRIIIEDVLGMSATRALAGLEDNLTSQQEQTLANTLQRLLDHEPIQYIIGSTDFCNLRFNVNPSVLIPRPETEKIVETALSLYAPNSNPRIMDACTGSGCIAISIKHSRPSWHVEACDVSTEALNVAQANAQLHNSDIHFSRINLLSDQLPSGPYDLIVSNPPYVMEQEKAEMNANVLDHEPHLALFVSDADPLIFYRALGQWGRSALHADGQLLVEINAALSHQTAILLCNQGYRTTIIKDCFDKDRFILCRK